MTEEIWQPIKNAPTDGTEIEVMWKSDHSEEIGTAVWSDCPVCMLGSRSGTFPPGWATGPKSETDTNLPLDEPQFWRELRTLTGV